MRDMPIRKFQRAAGFMGFPTPAVGGVFTATDGLQCAACSTRRETLIAMSTLRRERPQIPGRLCAGPSSGHPAARQGGRKERAPGALTPGAPDDQPRLGE
jgi:hypothetical protein